VDAQPKPTKKPVEKAEPVPLPTPVPEVIPAPVSPEPELLALPTELPPTPVEPMPPPPEPVKVTQKPPKETPVVKPKPTTKNANVPSVASQASKESDGAVDELPQESINPRPGYPQDALEAGLEGSPKLLLKIDATGRVIEAKLHTSSGVPSLDAAALGVIRRWEFRPAMRNGRAVPFEILKRFEFTIRRGY
jgi:protein TonB